MGKRICDPQQERCDAAPTSKSAPPTACAEQDTLGNGAIASGLPKCAPEEPSRLLADHAEAPLVWYSPIGLVPFVAPAAEAGPAAGASAAAVEGLGAMGLAAPLAVGASMGSLLLGPAAAMSDIHPSGLEFPEDGEVWDKGASEYVSPEELAEREALGARLAELQPAAPPMASEWQCKADFMGPTASTKTDVHGNGWAPLPNGMWRMVSKATDAPGELGELSAAPEFGDERSGKSLSLPPGGVRAPAPRHKAASVDQSTRAVDRNTVMEPWVAVAGDVAAINAGKAKLGRGENGELTATVNGRTYAVEPSGTLSPRTGEGFTTLSRAAFKALGVYNQFGDSERAREILELMEISEEEAAPAKAVWSRYQ